MKMCTPQSNTFLTTAQGKSLPQFPISSEIQLAEVLSLTKNGIITLWVDPHKDPSRVPSGKKRKGIVYKLYKTSHILPHLKLNMQVFFYSLSLSFSKIS